MSEPCRWYVGYSDGKPHTFDTDLDGQHAALYPSRREARKYYQDVREVRLVPVRQAARKGKRR